MGHRIIINFNFNISNCRHLCTKFLKLPFNVSRCAKNTNYNSERLSLFHSLSCNKNQSKSLFDVSHNNKILSIKIFHTSSLLRAVVPFDLLDIGEGIVEVQILSCSKNVGDHIEEMEEFCVVHTGKAAVTITSRYTGIIKKLHIKEGGIFKIGSTLMEIDISETENTDPSDQSNIYDTEECRRELYSDEPSSEKSSEVKDYSRYSHKSTLVSPACRKLAGSLGIALENVQGTGKSGRITKEDIQRYQDNMNSLKISTSEPQSSNSSQTENNQRLIAEDTVIEIKGNTAAMLRSMNESNKIPQLNIGTEYDVTELVNIMEKLKEKSVKSYEVKLSLTAFLVKLISIVLTKFPILNSKVDRHETTYTIFASHNVSIAIDSAFGLVVPNIKNVQNLSLIEIQKEILRLRNLADSNALKLSDISNGTVAISNVGVLGGTYIKPLLFDNQALMVGVGQIVKALRLDENDEILKRKILYCSFSADHRHCDGATVAKFSNEMKLLIQNPYELLLHLK